MIPNRVFANESPPKRDAQFNGGVKLLEVLEIGTRKAAQERPLFTN